MRRALDYLAERNAQALMAWRERRQWGEPFPDAWPPTARFLIDRWFAEQRVEARLWMDRNVLSSVGRIAS